MTICTQEKKCLFGKIVDGKMILNKVGKVARDCWLKIPTHFPNVILRSFVIIPNHVHGIIIIENGNVGASIYGAPKNENCANSHQGAINRRPYGGFSKSKNPMKTNSLGKIIRWYKGRCTFEIRKKSYQFFQWQRNYHEHIIRNEKSLQKIQDYIVHNPELWEKDCFFVL